MTTAETIGYLSPRRAKLLARMNAVTTEELTCFIGSNPGRFLPTWEKMRSQAGGKSYFIWSWNWPAFFFGFAWFMYRKMYGAAALFFFAPIAVALFTPASGGLAYAGSVGLLGKMLYLHHARSKIQKIKDRAATPEEAAEKIAGAGGVSVLAGVLGGLIWLGLQLLILAPLIARRL